MTTASRWDEDPNRPLDRLAVHFDIPSSLDIVADPIDVSLETMTSRNEFAQVAEVHDRLVLSDDAARWLAETLLTILLKRGHGEAHSAVTRLNAVIDSMLPDLKLDSALKPSVKVADIGDGMLSWMGLDMGLTKAEVEQREREANMPGVFAEYAAMTPEQREAVSRHLSPALREWVDAAIAKSK